MFITKVCACFCLTLLPILHPSLITPKDRPQFEIPLLAAGVFLCSQRCGVWHCWQLVPLLRPLRHRRLYLAMGSREAGSVIWLHSSSTTTGNLSAFRQGKGQAAHVTPTTFTCQQRGENRQAKVKIILWFISVQYLTRAGQYS